VRNTDFVVPYLHLFTPLRVPVRCVAPLIRWWNRSAQPFDLYRYARGTVWTLCCLFIRLEDLRCCYVWVFCIVPPFTVSLFGDGIYSLLPLLLVGCDTHACVRSSVRCWLRSCFIDSLLLFTVHRLFYSISWVVIIPSIVVISTAVGCPFPGYVCLRSILLGSTFVAALPLFVIWYCCSDGWCSSDCCYDYYLTTFVRLGFLPQTFDSL